MKNSAKCVITALSIVAVAGIGSIFTSIGQEWYSPLEKPTQWPPSFIFPVVWSTIYLLAFIVLCRAISNDTATKSLFVRGVINGILNVLWCLVFFTLKLTFVGVVVIVFNAVASVVFVRQIEGKIQYAMWIYPLWVMLATMLNVAVWILN